MFELGLGFVMMRQGPEWAFAKTFLCKGAFKVEVQIEPFGSIRTVRFDRVTGPTAGFGGSWPVLILNGLISRSDRNCDRSTVEPVGPAGPVRFLKHWF